ncbi:sugar transferase [Bradyrhizobium sp. UFLA05-112]
MCSFLSPKLVVFVGFWFTRPLPLSGGFDMSASAYRSDELRILEPNCGTQLQRPTILQPSRDYSIAESSARPLLPVSEAVAIELQRPSLSVRERFQKRCLDIGCASVTLVALAPLIITTAILIKLETPGPIILRQSRRGLNGKPFEIWRFRSIGVAENGSKVPQANGGRVTRVGEFLRKTSIEELPQLWNVLRGEVSLVGPRPHALVYDRLISKYVWRYQMKPGLIDWAQANGFGGATPTVDLMEKRVQCEAWYVRHWSIWLDVRIIFRTAVALMYQEAD